MARNHAFRGRAGERVRRDYIAFVLDETDPEQLRFRLLSPVRPAGRKAERRRSTGRARSRLPKTWPT